MTSAARSGSGWPPSRNASARVPWRPDGCGQGEQEVSMLALHLLQSGLVHVNTLLVQQVLADPKWADTLAEADRRGLSPLFWTHVNPYGRFELDMNSRLDLDLGVGDRSTSGWR
ncbi:Tn3 family transposase [Streptomyces sp. NPDC006923]|uniref:Tn3 family transposase n=1 Tax=Streptomyces sp. NPDC006923 TaxID=3155355 RepID=UPI0033EE03B9